MDDINRPAGVWPPCFRIQKILPLIEPVRTGNQEEDLRATTAKFTTVFQHLVEQYPDHWLWIHKRWKRRPDGEAPIYT